MAPARGRGGSRASSAESTGPTAPPSPPTTRSSRRLRSSSQEADQDHSPLRELPPATRSRRGRAAQKPPETETIAEEKPSNAPVAASAPDQDVGMADAASDDDLELVDDFDGKYRVPGAFPIYRYELKPPKPAPTRVSFAPVRGAPLALNPPVSASAQLRSGPGERINNDLHLHNDNINANANGIISSGDDDASSEFDSLFDESDSDVSDISNVPSPTLKPTRGSFLGPTFKPTVKLPKFVSKDFRRLHSQMVEPSALRGLSWVTKLKDKLHEKKQARSKNYFAFQESLKSTTWEIIDIMQEDPFVSQADIDAMKNRLSPQNLAERICESCGTSRSMDEPNESEIAMMLKCTILDPRVEFKSLPHLIEHMGPTTELSWASNLWLNQAVREHWAPGLAAKNIHDRNATTKIFTRLAGAMTDIEKTALLVHTLTQNVQTQVEFSEYIKATGGEAWEAMHREEARQRAEAEANSADEAAKLGTQPESGPEAEDSYRAKIPNVLHNANNAEHSDPEDPDPDLDREDLTAEDRTAKIRHINAMTDEQFKHYSSIFPNNGSNFHEMRAVREAEDSLAKARAEAKAKFDETYKVRKFNLEEAIEGRARQLRDMPNNGEPMPDATNGEAAPTETGAGISQKRNLPRRKPEFQDENTSSSNPKMSGALPFGSLPRPSTPQSAASSSKHSLLGGIVGSVKRFMPFGHASEPASKNPLPPSTDSPLANRHATSDDGAADNDNVVVPKSLRDIFNSSDTSSNHSADIRGMVASSSSVRRPAHERQAMLAEAEARKQKAMEDLAEAQRVAEELRKAYDEEVEGQKVSEKRKLIESPASKIQASNYSKKTKTRQSNVIDLNAMMDEWDEETDASLVGNLNEAVDEDEDIVRAPAPAPTTSAQPVAVPAVTDDELLELAASASDAQSMLSDPMSAASVAADIRPYAPFSWHARLTEEQAAQSSIAEQGMRYRQEAARRGQFPQVQQEAPPQLVRDIMAPLHIVGRGMGTSKYAPVEDQVSAATHVPVQDNTSAVAQAAQQTPIATHQPKPIHPENIALPASPTLASQPEVAQPEVQPEDIELPASPTRKVLPAKSPSKLRRAGIVMNAATTLPEPTQPEPMQAEPAQQEPAQQEASPTRRILSAKSRKSVRWTDGWSAEALNAAGEPIPEPGKPQPTQPMRRLLFPTLMPDPTKDDPWYEPPAVPASADGSRKVRVLGMESLANDPSLERHRWTEQHPMSMDVDQSNLGDPHRARPYTGQMFRIPGQDDGGNVFAANKTDQSIQQRPLPNYDPFSALGPTTREKFQPASSHKPRDEPAAKPSRRPPGLFQVPDDDDEDASMLDTAPSNGLMLGDFEQSRPRHLSSSLLTPERPPPSGFEDSLPSPQEQVAARIAGRKAADKAAAQQLLGLSQNRLQAFEQGNQSNINVFARQAQQPSLAQDHSMETDDAAEQSDQPGSASKDANGSSPFRDWNEHAADLKQTFDQTGLTGKMRSPTGVQQPAIDLAALKAKEQAKQAAQQSPVRDPTQRRAQQSNMSAKPSPLGQTSQSQDDVDMQQQGSETTQSPKRQPKSVNVFAKSPAASQSQMVKNMQGSAASNSADQANRDQSEHRPPMFNFAFGAQQPEEQTDAYNFQAGVSDPTQYNTSKSVKFDAYRQSAGDNPFASKSGANDGYSSVPQQNNDNKKTQRPTVGMMRPVSTQNLVDLDDPNRQRIFQPDLFSGKPVASASSAAAPGSSKEITNPFEENARASKILLEFANSGKQPASEGGPSGGSKDGLFKVPEATKQGVSVALVPGSSKSPAAANAPTTYVIPKDPADRFKMPFKPRYKPRNPSNLRAVSTVTSEAESSSQNDARMTAVDANQLPPDGDYITSAPGGVTPTGYNLFHTAVQGTVGWNAIENGGYVPAVQGNAATFTDDNIDPRLLDMAETVVANPPGPEPMSDFLQPITNFLQADNSQNENDPDDVMMSDETQGPVNWFVRDEEDLTHGTVSDPFERAEEMDLTTIPDFDPYGTPPYNYATMDIGTAFDPNAPDPFNPDYLAGSDQNAGNAFNPNAQGTGNALDPNTQMPSTVDANQLPPGERYDNMMVAPVRPIGFYDRPYTMADILADSDLMALWMANPEWFPNANFGDVLAAVDPAFDDYLSEWLKSIDGIFVENPNKENETEEEKEERESVSSAMSGATEALERAWAEYTRPDYPWWQDMDMTVFA